MRVKLGETSILATDFSGDEEEMKFWIQDRDLKIQIWRDYQNYIDLLEKVTSHKGYEDFNWKIKKRIKQLKKIQKQFEVEPILSFAPERLEPHVKQKKKV